MNKLDFSYNPETDVLMVEGIKYSGHLFRAIGKIFDVGERFEITERELDGVVTVRRIT
jgi:hypothetical protein